MREIKYIVVHCTGGHQHAKVADLKHEFKLKGWKRSGYHFFIDQVGNVHNLECTANVANGVAGFNESSVHVAYAGGLRGFDNRNNAQKESLITLLRFLKNVFKDAQIVGHNDLNPKKVCPCFNAKEEYKNI